FVNDNQKFDDNRVNHYLNSDSNNFTAYHTNSEKTNFVGAYNELKQNYC
ncbi:17083_t:CDS:1, partial [Gigaspora margarita]